MTALIGSPQRGETSRGPAGLGPGPRRPFVGFAGASKACLAAVAVLIAAAAAARAQTPIAPTAYEATTLRISDLVGVLQVEVTEGESLVVTLHGRAELLDGIDVRVDENTLVIERSRSLLDWPQREVLRWRDQYPTVAVQVPAGTALEIDNMVGQAKIGDLKGPLRLEAAWLSAEIGELSEADIELSGRGSLSLGRIVGGLRAELSGSGDLSAGAVGEAEIRKSGSGDVRLGKIERGLSYEGTGSGDMTADSVRGPVEVWINGGGNVRLLDGRAEPLRVRISGSGNFTLDGEAVNADLAVDGSGKITLASHIGSIRLRAFTGRLLVDDDGRIRVAR